MILHRFIKQKIAGNQPLRLAVLGGATTSQLVMFLENFLAHLGIDFVVWESKYGLYRQAILEPEHELNAFKPDIIFLAVHSRDVAASTPLILSPQEADEAARREYDQWSLLWQKAYEQWGSQIIQNLFETEPWGALGHYGSRHHSSRERLIARLNICMADHAPPYVLLHDVPMLAFECGAGHWFDPRYYLEAKMICSPECLVPYAHSVASIIAAIKGKNKKVLVLDLDNTLWGGAIGDDGIEGIRVGQGSAEGECFVAFQSYCRDLKNRGVLLAVCSKNEDAIAREPFEKIPEMVLKIGDFSAFVANWQNKAENLRSIAQMLNLGIDSFVFIDDNPIERALVRRFIPDVAVPDMPVDPAGYVQAVAAGRYFELTALTNEDLERSDIYAQNARRRALEVVHTDMDSFLASLEMQSLVQPINELNLQRSVQLINKSNQFNLTTRRCTIAEIKTSMQSPDWFSMTFGLRDHLGDNGLISVILGEVADKNLNITTWVMSCRVLQRGVELMAMSQLMEYAKLRHCSRITGLYIPTSKNAMVKDHYQRLGFVKQRELEDGTVEWILFLDQSAQPFKHHIKVVST